MDPKLFLLRLVRLLPQDALSFGATSIDSVRDSIAGSTPGQAQKHCVFERSSLYFTPNQQAQHIPRVKEGRKVSFDTCAARASHEIHAYSVRLLLAARLPNASDLGCQDETLFTRSCS